MDFACIEASVIVEADGGQHQDSASDVTRDAKLARLVAAKRWQFDKLRAMLAAHQSVAPLFYLTEIFH